MNVVIFAQHHGALYTIGSLAKIQDRIKNLVVMVPQEQQLKYQSMFQQDFARLIKTAVKKVVRDAMVIVDDFKPTSPVVQACEVTNKVDPTSCWLFLQAGSLLTGSPELFSGWLAATEQKGIGYIPESTILTPAAQMYGTAYPKMYEQLMEPVDNKIDPFAAVYRGPSIQKVNFMARNRYSKPDVLVDGAFGPNRCLQHAEDAVSPSCFFISYWSMYIKDPDQLSERELLAYPLDQYGAANKSLPRVTRERANENVSLVKRWQLPFRGNRLNTR